MSDSHARQPRVVLIGPPGSGKSTTGRLLADILQVDTRDTDLDIEETAGKAIAEIFIDDGEPHFRALEHEAVTTALAVFDGVLALGGGAVLDPRSEAALAQYAQGGGVVVFLDVTLAHVASRVGFNQARPLLLGNPRAKWQALMTARRPVYQRLATHTVLTDAKPPRDVADEIVAVLAAPDPTETVIRSSATGVNSVE